MEYNFFDEETIELVNKVLNSEKVYVIKKNSCGKKVISWVYVRDVVIALTERKFGALDPVYFWDSRYQEYGDIIDDEFDITWLEFDDYGRTWSENREDLKI